MEEPGDPSRQEGPSKTFPSLSVRPSPPPDSRNQADHRDPILPFPSTEPPEKPLQNADPIGGATRPGPASSGIPVSNNKDASRSPPPARPAASGPSEAAAPGLAPPPQARPQRPCPRGPTHLHLRGCSRGVWQKGLGAKLCRRAVLHQARSAKLPPRLGSPSLGTGPAREERRELLSPATGRVKTAVPEEGPLALPSPASSQRPCSSTRARVLLTNGPGARRWSCRRRRLLSGLRSRVAVVAAAAAAAATTAALSGTADTTQTQPGLSSPFCASFQPGSLRARPRGGRKAGKVARGTSRGLAKPGVGH